MEVAIPPPLHHPPPPIAPEAIHLPAVALRHQVVARPAVVVVSPDLQEVVETN